MKTSTQFLATVLTIGLAGTSAWADDLTGGAPQGASRAEVKAEARQAEHLGQIPRGEARMAHPDFAPPTTSSRALVKEQTRLAMASDLIARGEEQQPWADVTARSTLSRASVKAATREAVREGSIPRGQSNLERN